MSKCKLLRDVTVEECRWLNKDFKEGEIVFIYKGPTYGCITSQGEAFTLKDGETPFFELPLNSVEEVV